MNITYKKVKTEAGTLRYSDYTGKWWTEDFNGKFRPSKPMPIFCECGLVILDIIDEGTFGLRRAS